MALSLYIHYPFCSSHGRYNDFYEEPFDPETEEQFGKALLTELRLVKESLPQNKRTVDTIYIGGGTPSLIDFWHFKYLISMIREYFELDPLTEFSFEINPESIDSAKLLALKELGVNRPIFGIQSFKQKFLKHLDSQHTLNDSLQAVYLARATGYTNFGIDMIFGFPGQTSAKLADDLDQLTDLAPPHVSYYQLTIEEDSPPGKNKNQNLRTPGVDLMAAMYRAIGDTLTKQSYLRYEISSYAIPGFECKHNLRYWEGGDYIGLGPSAHSFLDGERFSNTSDVKEYITRLSKNERALVYDNGGKETRMMETIMLSLRTARGLERNKFLQTFGVSVEQALNIDRFQKLIDSDLITFEGDHIRLTETGFPLADEIVARLVK